MDEPGLVYILAASHSGSTLTAMLLNAHPDICTAGELKAPRLGETSGYRCSCRTLIGDCPFWRQIAEAMKSAGFEYDVRAAGTSLRNAPGFTARLLRPLHRSPPLEAIRDAALSLSPGWRPWLAAWGARNQALVESIARVSGARMVADSSKVALRLKYLRRSTRLPIKVIHLVRDGRAVALTYMDPSNFADAADPGLRGGGSGKQPHLRLGMREAALVWRRSNEEACEALKHFPDDDKIRITYEDLCADPSGTLNVVYRFLGLGESDAFKGFKAAEHHVVGNGMRLDDTSEIRLDDRWRDTLKAPELREFDRVAGRLNQSFGYV